MKSEAVNVSVFNSTSPSHSAEAAGVYFSPLHHQPQQIRIICLSYTRKSKLTWPPPKLQDQTAWTSSLGFLSFFLSALQYF